MAESTYPVSTPPVSSPSTDASTMWVTLTAAEFTVGDVADSLGISHQALSERVRRAYHQLIKTELAVNGEQQQ